MFLALLGLLPTLAPLFLGYLTHKADAGTESEKTQANLVLGLVQARMTANASDNHYFSLRWPKSLLFGSVSFYVSMVFIASGLGIDTTQFAVQHVPADLDYVIYAIIGYWTLNTFKA